MHPAATYASHTDNTVQPSCPAAPIPPLTPNGAALAAFPPVDLMRSRAALSVSVSAGDDGYRRRQSIGVGFIQATIGALCIVFNAVSLAFYDGQQARSGVGFVGHGFWIGMMFIVTGTLGLAAGKSRTRCTITAFMTMCIISAMFTMVLLSLGVTGAIATSRGGGYGCVGGSGKGSPYGFSYHYPHYYRPPCYTFQVVVAMEACMAIAAFFEATVAIWGAVICCQSRICCCSRPTHAAMVLPVTYDPHNGQLMYLTRPQEGLQVIYASPSSIPYSQGAIGIAPLSYQTSYVQSAWCRPQQINVAGAVTGTAIPMNSPTLPPPYQSYPPHSCRQPVDHQQKY